VKPFRLRNFLSIALVAGCAAWLPAPTPMSSAWLSAAHTTDRLLVLLPGRADTAEDFKREGFAEIARAAGVDVVAAEASLGYYARETLPERLSEDVIEPARRSGYAAIWLAGVSMGGLGTLYYAKARPGVVAGVLAIAPYLGDDDVIDEIEAAGGLSRWMPPARIDPKDWERSLWSWLQACTSHRIACPPIFLGYGENDRLAKADRLLAAALPPERVLVVSGGHDWEPWRRIFASQIGPLLTTEPRSPRSTAPARFQR
jgi:enterochelin esterase-like enzyme